MLGAVFGILFFLSLFNSFSKNKVWVLVLIIYFSGFIQTCWGIIQLWFLPSLLDTSNFPSGVFQQRNVMSSYITTTFIASLMLISTYPVPSKKINTLVCNSINLFALVVGILITSINSSATYLALVISLPFMLIAHWENKKSILRVIIILFVGLFIGVAISRGSITGVGFIQNITGISIEGALNSGGREIIWSICWEMFKDNWLTGVGYGNFEHAFLEYQAQYYQQYGVYTFEKLNHPHNEFILWAVEGGVLPALAFSFYTLYIIYRMIKMGKPALIYAALLLPLVIHALLEFPFYHSAIHWILFVTLLFIFEIEASNGNTVKITKKIFVNSVASVVTLGAALFFITNMQAINILNRFNHSDIEKRNMAVLSNITNHFTVQTHLDYFAMKVFINRGMAEKDITYINKSILLSKKLNANHPRPAYYKNMLIGYEALGDKENFKVKLDEARYFYPLNEYFLGVEERFKLIL